MVIIKGKEYAPRIALSTIILYCRKEGIGVSKFITLLNDIPLADMVGVFVFAARDKDAKLQLTEADFYEELDSGNQKIIEDLITYFSEQVQANIPQSEIDEDPKKKGKK